MKINHCNGCTQCDGKYQPYMLINGRMYCILNEDNNLKKKEDKND